MATEVIGYPQETNFCPQCGSSDITANDRWCDDGLVKCASCGATCYVIQAE